MLFITNRMPRGSRRSRKGRKWHFAPSNEVSNSVYFCEFDEHSGASIEIMGEPFFARVKDSSCRQVLLYLHGFNNQPDTIFQRAAEMQGLVGDDIMVMPMIWPCDEDFGVVKDYWDDQRAADATGMAFSRVLGMFYAWSQSQPESDPCRIRINILAHSMGNRVLRESLALWDRYELAEGAPLLFRNVFMVAADVVNESLHRGSRGSVIAAASRNVVVYFASDDLALRSSKVANVRNRIASRRLGHTGPEDMRLVPDNVYAVDCDDFNIAYDSPVGHAYFGVDAQGQPGALIRHVLECVTTGRVPAGPDRRLLLQS